MAITKEVSLKVGNEDYGLFRVEWNNEFYTKLCRLSQTSRKEIMANEVLSNKFFTGLNGFLMTAKKIDKYTFKSSLVKLHF